VDTASQASRATVAAFDVDGTLTRRDNVVPFLLRTARARLVLALVRQPTALVRAIAHRDRDSLKALACSSLAGLPATTLQERGAAFAREIQRRRLRHDTQARLKHHRELGHVVVLVSASLDAYLDPLGALLGVDRVICTRLAVDGEGNLTGALDGANCRGPEKAARLSEWMEREGLAGAELWAYGDSSGDDELLALADHPMLVRNTEIGPLLDSETSGYSAARHDDVADR
jgi:phosphatidylglycerophosphatase C